MKDILIGEWKKKSPAPGGIRTHDLLIWLACAEVKLGYLIMLLKMTFTQ